MNDENILIKMNLNLLVVFMAIYQEKSLTRAAAVLNVGQPAVSSALAKMRVIFNDKLFLRTKGGMGPTRAGKALARKLLPIMGSLEQLLSSTVLENQ